ncbi:MAG: ethanolamine ammonia-lyase reactivating factor EutA [Oscillospiraceae bacterium]|nr:ethanolamine ammonia-lyase reactivating factor EutA [Oscillospiraceae bacterium]
MYKTPRLPPVDGGGRVRQITAGLARLFPSLSPGQAASPEALEPVLRLLTGALAWAAGLEKAPGPWERLVSAGTSWTPPADVQVLSFSGGVADCVFAPPDDRFAYGDLGVLLGRAIAASLALNALPWVRGRETIRATVVGAGAHATQVSGSTIFYRNVPFPLKNLPVLPIDGAGPEEIRRRLGWFANEEGLTQTALSLTGWPGASWEQVQKTARIIARGTAPLRERGLWPVVTVERDMAKALGQALAALVDGPLLCLDGISARQGDYLDIGPPAAGGTVLPVVVKTLAFEGPQGGTP